MQPDAAEISLPCLDIRPNLRRLERRLGFRFVKPCPDIYEKVVQLKCNWLMLIFLLLFSSEESLRRRKIFASSVSLNDEEDVLLPDCSARPLA